MFLIVGYVIILAAALGTYAIHGSLLALWVPAEYVAIIGLTIGYFVAANKITVIKATVGAIPGVLKGSKFNKAFYIDALAMLFEVFPDTTNTPKAFGQTKPAFVYGAGVDMPLWWRVGVKLGYRGLYF